MDRLVSINGVLQATYRYDSLGQQVVRHLVQEGQVLHALFGPERNRIGEYLYDPVSGSSTLLREYLWLDGRAVAVVEGGVRAGAVGSSALTKSVAVANSASRGPGLAIQQAAAAARAGGASAREVGNAAHRALNGWVKANKPTWASNQSVRTIAGPTIRPDIITPRGRYIDLKPNTVSGRVAGAAKAAYCYGLTGVRTRIIYY